MSYEGIHDDGSMQELEYLDYARVGLVAGPRKRH